MTRPFFTRDRISDFDNFDRHAEDALSQLNNRLREGFPVDFQVRCIALFFGHNHSRRPLGNGCPIHIGLCY